MFAFLKNNRALLITAAALLPIFISILAGDRGYAAPESCCFLMHYNTPGVPLAKLIFDPAKTDWGFYQARELSYLFDYLDSRIIAWCIKHKIAHFFSIVSLLFFAATIFAQQYFTAKLFPRLRWYAAMLPSLMFAFANVSSTHTFFRSSKPIAAFLITLIFFSVLSLVMDAKKLTENRRCAAVSAVSVLLLPFIDRQGFFFTGVFCCANIALWAAGSWGYTIKKFSLSENFRTKARFFSLISFASLFLSTLWNVYICPEIIYQLNGYYPSFEYQRLPDGALFFLSGGLPFVFENIGFLIISYYFPLLRFIGFIVIVILLAAAVRATKQKSSNILLLISFAGMLTACIIIGNLMTARHIMILRNDVLFSNYFLPSLALFAGFMTVLLAEAETLLRRTIMVIAALAIISGIALHAKVLPRPGEDIDLMYPYRLFAPNTIHLLNHPEKEKLMPLPFTNSILIDFFRGEAPGL